MCRGNELFHYSRRYQSLTGSQFGPNGIKQLDEVAMLQRQQKSSINVDRFALETQKNY